MTQKIIDRKISFYILTVINFIFNIKKLKINYKLVLIKWWIVDIYYFFIKSLIFLIDFNYINFNWNKCYYIYYLSWFKTNFIFYKKNYKKIKEERNNKLKFVNIVYYLSHVKKL